MMIIRILYIVKYGPKFSIRVMNNRKYEGKKREFQGEINLCSPRVSEYPQTSSVFTSSASLWNIGTVTVSFVNGDCDQRSKVRTHASEWIPYSNINFVFIDEPYRGDIRVGFYNNLGGSWSLVGMDSKHYSFDVNTGQQLKGMRGISMNLYSTSRRTILHEFGRK